MLPRKYRISVVGFNRNKIKTVSFFSEIMNISVKPNNLSHARFTVSVPKYLDKRSTKRHQTKRIILEAVREILEKIKPCDALIKSKKILKKENRLLVSIEIKKLFEKASLIEKHD